MKKIINLAILATLGLGISGCAYRTDSGINIPENINSTSSTVLISESNLNDKNCKTVEQIDVSVKKLTAFHPDPTKEQVDYVLSGESKNT